MTTKRKQKRNPKVRVEYIRVYDEPEDKIITEMRKALGLVSNDRRHYYGKATIEGKRTVFSFNGYGLDEMDMHKRVKVHALKRVRDHYRMNRYDCKK